MLEHIRLSEKPESSAEGYSETRLKLILPAVAT